MNLRKTWPGLAACVFVPVLMGIGYAAWSFGRADHAVLDIRSQRVVGNELRVLVETYRSWRPVLSHSFKAADAKGYYVVADLSSTASPAERIRIFGPLWDVPDTRSELSLQGGGDFTADDVRATDATGGWAFDPDGTLIRSRTDPSRTSLQCQALKVVGDTASWQTRENTPIIKDTLGPMSEDRVATTSGRYRLLYDKGKAHLYEEFTGAERQDPWLTRCFADARSIKGFKNVRPYLTDDLKFLVLLPHEIWNDGHGTIHETFEYRGKTYQRKSVGLVYQRDTDEPTFFPRPTTEGSVFAGWGPSNVFSIRGELYFFNGTDQRLLLVTLDGNKKFELKSPLGMTWGNVLYREAQLDPERGELILFGKAPEAHMTVTRWHYAAGTITQADAPIGSLFQPRWGQLRPRSLLPIR